MGHLGYQNYISFAFMKGLAVVDEMTNEDPGKLLTTEEVISRF